MFKNLPAAEAVTLAELVAYQDGQVVSRTLMQHEGVSLTLFAFAAGEGLTSHTTPADAFVLILEGEAVIEISGERTTLVTGEAIVMPANVPHAVTAQTRFKMLLTIAS